MGVTGLTIFLEEKQRMLGVQTQLKGKTVVIDASSFARTFLEKSSHHFLNIDFQFVFQGWKELLERLVESGCKIIAFFDGGMEPIKAKTSTTRITSRIRKTGSIGQKLLQNEKFNPISALNASMPILLQPLFMSAVHAAGGECYQAHFEADQQLAAFCHQQKEPAIMLTEDSDFIIFDVGNSIHYAPHTMANLGQWMNSKVPFLTVTTFNSATFSKLLNVPSHLLPVISWLCGNDFTETKLGTLIGYEKANSKDFPGGPSRGKQSLKDVTSRSPITIAAEIVQAMCSKHPEVTDPSLPVAEIVNIASRYFNFGCASLTETFMKYSLHIPFAASKVVPSSASALSLDPSLDVPSIVANFEFASSYFSPSSPKSRAHHEIVLASQKFGTPTIMAATVLSMGKYLTPVFLEPGCAKVNEANDYLCVGLVLQPLRSLIYGLLFSDADEEQKKSIVIQEVLNDRGTVLEVIIAPKFSDHGYSLVDIHSNQKTAHSLEAKRDIFYSLLDAVYVTAPPVTLPPQFHNGYIAIHYAAHQSRPVLTQTELMALIVTHVMSTLSQVPNKNSMTPFSKYVRLECGTKSAQQVKKMAMAMKTLHLAHLMHLARNNILCLSHLLGRVIEDGKPEEWFSYSLLLNCMDRCADVLDESDLTWSHFSQRLKEFVNPLVEKLVYTIVQTLPQLASVAASFSKAAKIPAVMPKKPVVQKQQQPPKEAKAKGNVATMDGKAKQEEKKKRNAAEMDKLLAAAAALPDEPRKAAKLQINSSALPRYRAPAATYSYSIAAPTPSSIESAKESAALLASLVPSSSSSASSSSDFLMHLPSWINK